MESDDSSKEHTHSITVLIERLRMDDPEAAAQIWRRYFERLLPLARAKLNALPHRAVDEEDILVSVFDRFFRAAKEDRFAGLRDRNDLWQILLMLTERRVTDEYRRSLARKRRGSEPAVPSEALESDYAQYNELADQKPGPEFIAAFNDNLGRAIRRLVEEKTREVALLRLEGYANREIADRLEISLSSVERKLRVIREVWQEEFAD